ncbi:Hypothetical_protein [Hexamita inflata]|uniref:Hypothetical_protein n=1 Tax=Hexamita inflata TaxID=28002 RepID=A0AA86NT82_9EUKA|nr:Hypothetical protein HINF_LOCUS12444 [Hexamita inflata]
MNKIAGSNLSGQLTVLNQFGIYSFMCYKNTIAVLNKNDQYWMDLTASLPESITSSKNSFMVYFSGKIPLIFQNNQIKTTTNIILLNDIQNVQYNNLTSKFSDTVQCIVQQNNEHYVLQLNYDESYQIKVELTKIENIIQPKCKSFRSESNQEYFFRELVEKFVNTEYNYDTKEVFWNTYTNVMHPYSFISQPVQLTFILNEIYKNSFKNVDNAITYLKVALSDQLIISELYYFICSQVTLFNFIYLNLNKVIFEIFNKNTVNMKLIFKLLLDQNRIDDVLELIQNTQSQYQAYEEFINYLNESYKDRTLLTLAKYQLFISNFKLLLQRNQEDLDLQSTLLILFEYHLIQYGTQHIRVSFDPDQKLYIEKHNALLIPDYATQLQVVILCNNNEDVEFFLSQNNEVSQLGLTCFQMAIIGGNTEMILKFQNQIQIQIFHTTSLVLLIKTYTESIPEQILNKLIDLQAGMTSQSYQCALYQLLNEPKPIPMKYQKILLQKEFKFVNFDSIVQFMTFLQLNQFRYLNQISFVDGISVSEAVLLTLVQFNKTYPAFLFINPEVRRNTRFSRDCVSFIDHKHFAFSLSHDISLLTEILSSQIQIEPLFSYLQNSQNLLRGFSCYDFAINFKKIETRDFKKIDYFSKPIVVGDNFDNIDVFQRDFADHQLLLLLTYELWSK